jgi:Fe-S-cluster-containing dehydrogenase component
MAPKLVSRRIFLKSVLAGGALTAMAGGTALARNLVSPKLAEKKAAYALIIDTTKCVGCGACERACNLRNHLPEDQSYVHILDRGEAEDERFLPVQCQHCADPPCAHVCPTKATYIHNDGVVLINEKLCVGCKYCMVACPYQARIFDEERGVADKCWLCLDDVLSGDEPACVRACILEARLFDRTDNPDSEVVQLIASGQAKPLHPEFGTEPAVLRYVIE